MTLDSSLILNGHMVKLTGALGQHERTRLNGFGSPTTSADAGLVRGRNALMSGLLVLVVHSLIQLPVPERTPVKIGASVILVYHDFLLAT